VIKNNKSHKKESNDPMTKERIKQIYLTSDRPFYELDFELGKETAIEALKENDLDFWIDKGFIFGQSWMDGYMSVYQAVR
jgi:hypothetical protein